MLLSIMLVYINFLLLILEMGELDQSFPGATSHPASARSTNKTNVKKSDILSFSLDKRVPTKSAPTSYSSASGT